MKATNRVVLNSGILYTKLIISLVIGLFTTRLVLNALGEIDYGIYALVAGVIGMLAFLNISMSTTSMRFMAHSLGSGDDENIKRTFNSSLIIHFILGILVVIVLEIVGLLIFEYLLKIPSDRISDAKIVFHFMVGTSFITIISVPFDAVMNAHENFLALSIIDTLGVLMRFGIAIYIASISKNLLILYGLLMFLQQVVLRILKQSYSFVKYDECKIKFKQYIDKKLIKKILSFASWSALGSIGTIFRVQVKSILLNMFFGVTLNAANGVALSLASHLNHVSASMTRSINPQITKSEGSGNREKMLKLTTTAAKFSLYLFSIFAIPVIIEMPNIFAFWLKNVPDYSVIFCRLLIVGMIMEKFTFQIMIAIKAVGKIKKVTIVSLIITFLIIPVSYVLFKLNYSPQTIYFVNIFIYVLIAIMRLYFGKVIAGLNIRGYLYDVFFRGAFPLTISAFITIIPLLLINQGFIRLIITFAVSIISSLVLIRFLGLTADEYIKIKKIISEGIAKFKLK